MSKHKSEQSSIISTLFKVFFVCCALLFLTDIVIHRHAHYAEEEWVGFYAVFGFVGVSLLVIVSKYILRPLTKQKEDYYD